MKPITLHPGSLLLGAAFSLLGLLAMGQKQVPDLGDYGPPQLTRPPKTEEEVPASAWFKVQQGTPYTVPQGKLLVIRAFGTPSDSYPGYATIRIKVDGSDALVGIHKNWESMLYGGTTTMTEVPRLFTVPAGAMVEIVGDTTNTTDAQAWCYLANE